MRFLTSRDESMLLKLAPLALVGILPPEILTNAIPVLGLADDVSYFILATFVIFKTLSRVNAYR